MEIAEGILAEFHQIRVVFLRFGRVGDKLPGRYPGTENGGSSVKQPRGEYFDPLHSVFALTSPNPSRKSFIFSVSLNEIHFKK